MRSCFLLLTILSTTLCAADLDRGFVRQRQSDRSCIALVVGNAAYADMPLQNPANDAADMAQSLEAVGFTVTKVTNANRADLQRAVDQFGKDIIGKQAAFFYFSGHGIQSQGENYLLPVGEDLSNEAEVRYKTVNAGLVLAQMEAAQCPVNVVVLDACRNNPLARMGKSAAKGLAQVQGPAGSLIVYATAAGQVAGDGEGRNGVFTTAFLRHLGTPGQDVDQFLRVVSAEVQQTSGGRQVPWRASNLTQTFCFVPPAEGATPSAPVAPVAAAPVGRMQAYAAAEALERQGGADAARWQAWSAVASAAPADRDDWTGRDEQMQAQAQRILAELRPKMAAVERSRTLSAAQTVDADGNASRRQRREAWAAVLAVWDVDDAVLTPVERDQIGVVTTGLTGVGLAFGKRGGAPWASAQGQDQFGKWADLTVAGVTQRMRLIPAGTFQMGSENGDSDEKPVHQVTMSQPFWLADSEVTQGLWQAVMGSNPSKFTGAMNPVEQVSWDDCQGFFQKLNGQAQGLRAGFPTESQWEYSCRAGTVGNYAGNLDAMAWYEKNSGGTTHLVKTRQPNIYGLYDMNGNVWEWCADWKDAYASGSQRDPTGPSSGSRRVNRGGSWSSLVRICRLADRSGDTPGYRSSILGFRLCAQATP